MLRSLRQESKTQKSSLISKEKANKVDLGGTRDQSQPYFQTAPGPLSLTHLVLTRGLEILDFSL